VRYPSGTELPPTQDQAYHRALRLERVSLVYWVSAIVLLYFTLGQSQAMKAAWIEDILGLFPPLAFLIASRFRHREPDEQYPWGYHRAITIAYVVSTVALFTLGAFIFIDSVDRLIKGDHPPIGMVEILDEQIWLGWLMMGALLYSGIPPIIFGRLKRPLAGMLHDKVLFADAKMNQADWLTAAAALVGVVGIGFGIWWADSAAAIVISLDILHDGQKFLRESVGDLMDESPKTPDESKPHPLTDRVRREVAATEWVADAAVALRESGHLITGEVWVVPHRKGDLASACERLSQHLGGLDWRLHAIVVVPLESLDDVPDGLRV
jgi:cation diffusion facilitator family transporter